MPAQRQGDGRVAAHVTDQTHPVSGQSLQPSSGSCSIKAVRSPPQQSGGNRHRPGRPVRLGDGCGSPVPTTTRPSPPDGSSTPSKLQPMSPSSPPGRVERSFRTGSGVDHAGPARKTFPAGRWLSATPDTASALAPSARWTMLIDTCETPPTRRRLPKVGGSSVYVDVRIGDRRR